MTRINTNVSSLSSQNSLQRNQSSLQTSLTRLSTGLRINSGKDDPAGLIASEILRSDIVGLQRGISNSHRANEMIATADSALGQVSNLLNDIRGLITEAANTGTMSAEMIAANQLQVDSSLEAIDRIAQVTQFQGGSLLDGSLDFITKNVNRDQITSLRIDQANLGTQDELDVVIDVVGQAEKAKLNYPFNAIADDLVVSLGGVDGYEAFTFDAGATIQEMAAAINLVSDATGVEASVEKAATQGHITASSAGKNNDLVITATEAGKVEGNINIKYTQGHSTGTTIDFDKSLGDDDPNTINVECKTEAYVAASVKQMDDTNLPITDWPATYSSYSAIPIDDGAGAPVLLGNINLTSTSPEAPATIKIDLDPTGTAGSEVASWDGVDTLTVSVQPGAGPGDSTFQDMIDAINNQMNGMFTATLSGTAGGTFLNVVSGVTYEAGTIAQTTPAISEQLNNAIDITAKIPGELMNDTSVHVVDRSWIHPSSRSTGTPDAMQAEYHYDAINSQMTLQGFAALATGNILIEAKTAGTEYNNVKIEWATDTAANLPDGAEAQYFTNEDNEKILQLTVRDDNLTTFTQLEAAIDKTGTFEVGASTMPGAGVIGAADRTNVSGNTYNTGGDKGTLYMYVDQGQTTAADVVDAINDPTHAMYEENARVRQLFTVDHSIDNDGTGMLFANTHTNALTGGVDGGAVVATAEDVMNALAGDTDASKLVSSEIASGNTGLSPVTIFEEYTTYGQINSGTGLQFLGPKDSRDIRFVSEPGTELSVDYTTYPDSKSFSNSTLSAFNENACFSITALDQGDSRDDMVVRFKASADSAGNATIDDNVVTYDPRPSAAQAYLTFDPTGASNRNMILSSVEHGAWMNDVQIIMQLDTTLAAGTATASFNQSQKMLTVTVADDTTTANTVMTAINDDQDGDGEPDTGFYAELDYSEGFANTGLANGFATWIAANGANDRATVADTGSTGGHEGGTLEVLVRSGTVSPGVDYASTEHIISSINSDNIVNKMFTATRFDNTTTPTGLINFREDSNQMITSGGIEEYGYMTVHLETSSDGLIQTTAKELVDYFNTLTAEQTQGVSVSLLQDDDNGNLGNGLLAATYPDPNASSTSTATTSDSDLVFQSEGIETVEQQASGVTTAINGVKAQLAINAVRIGAEYDNTEIMVIGNPVATGVTVAWDEPSKSISITVPDAGANVDDVVAAFSADLGDYFDCQQAFPDATNASSTAVVMPGDKTILSGGEVAEGTVEGAPFVGNEDIIDKGLTIQSTDYGSRAFVSVVAQQGTFNVYDPAGEISDRNTGIDVDLRLNSTQMVGDGRTATMNTATLDVKLTVAAELEVGNRLTFQITGGGATFQLGPEVVSNQQARLGIQSINTTRMGGEEGKLFELRTGGSADLSTDPTKAFQIVQAAILDVTDLRGRLGAFQRTTIETNIAALSDTLVALTSAESDIRDTDFASESAALTRSQVLVQSGISVLGIANQQPQSVLSLLR